MRKHLCNLLVAVLTVGLTSAHAEDPVSRSSGNDASAVTVSNLRCEYLKDPLGIDVEKPRLSWIIESVRRGERQTAYRILVASTPELLARHQGDLWDSGKVASDQSVQLEYAGKALESPEISAWRIRAEWAISDFIARGSPFTADDIVACAGLPKLEAEQNRNNAVGAFFGALSRRRLIKPLGFAAATRTVSHARTLRVWQGG